MDAYHRMFQPTGDWWGLPAWRKAVLMLTLRPYCKVKGYAAAARQWLALRAPDRPFHPMAWVHPHPCDMEAEYGDCRHEQFHPDTDGCLDGHEWGGPHYLQYERVLDVPYSLADDFDLKVGRMYSFVSES